MARALIPLAQGCEELEAVTLIDLLRRAGIEVVVAGLTEGPVTASRGTVLVPDTTLAAVADESFDLIVLPGGLPGADHLAADLRLRGMLQRQAAAQGTDGGHLRRTQGPGGGGAPRRQDGDLLPGLGGRRGLRRAHPGRCPGGDGRLCDHLPRPGYGHGLRPGPDRTPRRVRPTRGGRVQVAAAGGLEVMPTGRRAQAAQSLAQSGAWVMSLTMAVVWHSGGWRSWLAFVV